MTSSHYYINIRPQPVAALTDYKLAMLLMLLIVYRKTNQDISGNSSHVPSLSGWLVYFTNLQLIFMDIHSIYIYP